MTDSLLNPPMWKNYGHLRDTILNGQRTLNEAYKYLQENYDKDFERVFR